MQELRERCKKAQLRKAIGFGVFAPGLEAAAVGIR